LVHRHPGRWRLSGSALSRPQGAGREEPAAPRRRRPRTTQGSPMSVRVSPDPAGPSRRPGSPACCPRGAPSPAGRRDETVEESLPDRVGGGEDEGPRGEQRDDDPETDRPVESALDEGGRGQCAATPPTGAGASSRMTGKRTFRDTKTGKARLSGTCHTKGARLHHGRVRTGPGVAGPSEPSKRPEEHDEAGDDTLIRAAWPRIRRRSRSGTGSAGGKRTRAGRGASSRRALPPRRRARGASRPGRS
jgi:hypothetical protein